MKRLIILSIALLLLAVPLGAAAQGPRVPDTVGAAPDGLGRSQSPSGQRPVNAQGLVYKTSLEAGDPGFSVYDPATDTWTQLTPYETSCRMAVSGAGQLYAYGYSTGTIDQYDPGSDTWSAVMAAPPGATGQYCDLQVTNAGEFLYTEAWSATLWYTVGGVWTSMALPFTTDIMGDYDPTADQYVIGEAFTTNAHWIDLNTWTITDYLSGVGNGEYSRFSVVMGNRYYFEAGGSDIFWFDLGNPAAPPTDTGVATSWYGSACADRGNSLIYNASIDGTALWVYDPALNTATPLTGGDFGWHSSLACVGFGGPPPPQGSLHLWKTKMAWGAIVQPYYKVAVRGFVHDQDHNRAGDVTLTGLWTYPDGTEQPVSKVTDDLGRWKSVVKVAQCGLYQFDVTGLSKEGYTYDPGANHTSPHTEIVVPCR